MTRIKLSPAALIMQGIERYWTNERLDDFLYPYRGDYIKQATDPKYRFQDIELNKRGTALFKSCLGVRTLGPFSMSIRWRAVKCSGCWRH